LEVFITISAKSFVWHHYSLYNRREFEKEVFFNRVIKKKITPADLIKEY